MSTCLDNIVSVSNPCSNEKAFNTSGYDLLDAPEINLSNISQIANSDQPNGYEFLKAQLKFAIRDVVNDFISVLNTNNLITQLVSDQIITGQFDNSLNNPIAGKCGITINRNQQYYEPNSIKRLTIHSVMIFPVDDHEKTNLFIQQGTVIKTFPIKLIGGKINKYSINYKSEGNDPIHVYLENIETYSSELTCLIGCNGSMPNQCGFVKGYKNGTEIQKEGFGINIAFSCDCDYESLLCRYAKSYVGKIIYLKSRANILQERLNNDRITSFIIYGREHATELHEKVENEYRETWNSFVESLPNLLINDSDCINCKRVKIVVNV
ncbi:Uncharacterised protein [Weeksella virosa]|uniref:Uncharacterized protein n=1 Tax=Weeksella virosa (strain ATCC 43766 / DSM 16922 / JCM 21250 / CCUG 30538 / CDC 9751 / IAM 14551 / NBRC 16016 / NCTC 11634 / CL345/78) TaxID=865938 RepID=F0NXQ6_WEEVC|nr:hypothetical protein [Weeksella virosa]ADX66963.1 hypothetical protein Weevi_0241 [Weeksella virosa DSM 16922]VEH63308.1 Uncharacterised protein [Weeksella virosa]